MIRGPLFLLVSALLVSPALGWNPVEFREQAPLRWDTSSTVEWNPDSGSFGLLDNLQITSLIRDGFDVWEAVPTATISFHRGGPIVDAGGSAVDVTAANYIEILDLDNGQNPVVYDNEQEIWALLGVSTSVLGFAGDLRTNGSTITKGFIALQGDWVDGITIRPPNCGNMRCDPELPVERYLNIVVHEIGHFVGLGHSSVNHEVGSVDGCPNPGIDVYETMSPLAHYAMETLHNDDIVGLSSLYPTPGYTAAFASISGRLVDRDGSTSFDGANVVLRPDTTDCTLLYEGAQATQTGVNPFENGGAGTYRFTGLDPATGYTLFVTEIDDGGGYTIGGASPPTIGSTPEYFSGIDEEHFDPPDFPDRRTVVLTGAAGSEAAGRDLKLNNPGGPGGLATSGADALVLTKTGSATVSLSWGVACNETQVPGQDYAVYAGTLAQVDGVQDHQPIACGTGGMQLLEMPVSGVDAYYLVAPLLADREGALGESTTGEARTPLGTCAEVLPDLCP